jgi:hypothetical protein
VVEVKGKERKRMRWGWKGDAKEKEVTVEEVKGKGWKSMRRGRKGILRGRRKRNKRGW